MMQHGLRQYQIQTRHVINHVRGVLATLWSDYVIWYTAQGNIFVTIIIYKRERLHVQQGFYLRNPLRMVFHTTNDCLDNSRSESMYMYM